MLHGSRFWFSVEHCWISAAWPIRQPLLLQQMVGPKHWPSPPQLGHYIRWATISQYDVVVNENASFYLMNTKTKTITWTSFAANRTVGQIAWKSYLSHDDNEKDANQSMHGWKSYLEHSRRSFYLSPFVSLKIENLNHDWIVEWVRRWETRRDRNYLYVKSDRTRRTIQYSEENYRHWSARSTYLNDRFSMIEESNEIVHSLNRRVKRRS